MPFLAFALARLREPSTYAGLSALAGGVAGALSLADPVSRYSTLVLVLAGALVAVLKADGATKAASEVESLEHVVKDAVPLVKVALAPTKPSTFTPNG